MNAVVHVWIHSLLGVVVVSLVLTMIAVLYVHKCGEDSQDQTLLSDDYRYDAVVLFDIEDVKMRT